MTAAGKVFDACQSIGVTGGGISGGTAAGATIGQCCGDSTAMPCVICCIPAPLTTVEGVIASTASQGIITRIANKLISTVTAAEGIVTSIATKGIVGIIAGQRVVVTAARKIFNIG